MNITQEHYDNLDCPLCGSSFELIHQAGDTFSFRCTDGHKEGCGVTWLVKGLVVEVVEEHISTE